MTSTEDDEAFGATSFASVSIKMSSFDETAAAKQTPIPLSSDCQL